VNSTLRVAGESRRKTERIPDPDGMKADQASQDPDNGGKEIGPMGKT
jgi:hypothetical protein